MKSSDIDHLLTLSRPSVHPDGSRVVVAVTRPDLALGSYVGQLWSVDLAGGHPRRVTRGRHDSAPQSSPDGTLIAFLRPADASPPQLAVVSTSSGEPLMLTDRLLGVTSFCWAPDSASLTCLSRDPEEGRYRTVDALPRSAEPPRHITSERYHSNGVGFTNDQRLQVFLVGVPDVEGEPAYPPAPSTVDQSPKPSPVEPATRLTGGPFDHTSIVFSPDGCHLAVVSAQHGRATRMCEATST